MCKLVCLWVQPRPNRFPLAAFCHLFPCPAIFEDNKFKEIIWKSQFSWD